jgi:hypothetical protein
MALFIAAQTSTSSQLTFARFSLCSFSGLNNHVLANCHERKREQGESHESQHVTNANQVQKPRNLK